MKTQRYFSFTVEDGEFYGEGRDRSTLLDETVVILSQEQLRQVSEWAVIVTD